MPIFGQGGRLGVTNRELEKALDLLWNRIDDRFTKAADRAAMVDDRFTKAADRAAMVDDRLTKIDGELEKIRIGLKGCEDHLGKVDERLTKMDDELEEIRISLKGCEDRLDKVEQAPSQIVYVRDTDGADAAAVHAQGRVKD
jgi:chromosome segregation ATPase